MYNKKAMKLPIIFADTTPETSAQLTWESFVQKLSDFFLLPDNQGVNYLTRILVAVVLIVVSFFVIRLITWAIKRAMGIKKKGPDIDISAKYFIVTLIKVIMWIAVAFVVIGILKIDTTGIAGVTSAITVALGLSLQDLIGSLFSGVLLLQQKNIKTGEFISVSNAFGTCEGFVYNIHLFFTHLKTASGQIITIPNKNMVSAAITNYSRLGKRRLDFDVGLSYDVDVNKAKAVFTELVENETKALQDEARTVYISKLDSYSVQFRIRLWTTFDDYWTVYNALSEKVLLACRDNGFNIPSSTDFTVKKEK